jgi:hypothetical protein
MKDYIAKKISYLLPNRVMLWCLVRLYAYTTVYSHPDKTQDEIGYSDLYKSWETKNDLWVTDDGRVNYPTVEDPIL